MCRGWLRLLSLGQEARHETHDNQAGRRVLGIPGEPWASTCTVRYRFMPSHALPGENGQAGR